MAGLLDFDLTPQQLGLLGAAGAMGQAYAPQPASRLPLAKPNAAYLLSQAASGLGQGYGIGLQQQGLAQQNYAAGLSNLNATLLYNLRAHAVGLPTVPMPNVPGAAPGPGTSGGIGGGSPPVAPAPATPGGAGATPQPSTALPPMPGLPQAPPLAGGALPPMPGVRVAGPGAGAPAPNSAAPVSPVGETAAQWERYALTKQAFGIPFTPTEAALMAANIPPTAPAAQNVLNAAVMKASGLTPVIGGERPGVPAQVLDPATMTYHPMAGQLGPQGAMAQGQYYSSLGKSQGELPAQEALAGYKRGLELGTTTVNIPLPNGQTRLMTQGDALAMAKGQARQLTAPPPPMTMKGDEVAAPDGSVIPAPPPAMGARMPGVTVGPTANAAKITEQWTNTIAPTVTAESYLTQIAQALKQTQSGGLAEVKANVANTLAGLGPAGQALAKQVMNAKDVANVQTILHGNILSTLNSLKAIVQGAGGRILKTEFEKVSEEALAHPDLSPQANFNIITQMMGILRANRSMVSGWTQASSGAAPSGRQWTDPERFESAWYDRNPISGFEAQAAKEIGPFKGMTGSPAYTQQDLEYTAKKYGLTVDEVKRRIGAGNAR